MLIVVGHLAVGAVGLLEGRFDVVARGRRVGLVLGMHRSRQGCACCPRRAGSSCRSQPAWLRGLTAGWWSSTGGGGVPVRSSGGTPLVVAAVGVDERLCRVAPPLPPPPETITITIPTTTAAPGPRRPRSRAAVAGAARAPRASPPRGGSRRRRSFSSLRCRRSLGSLPRRSGAPRRRSRSPPSDQTSSRKKASSSSSRSGLRRHSRIEFGLDQAGGRELLGEHPGVAERVQRVAGVADDQRRLRRSARRSARCGAVSPSSRPSRTASEGPGRWRTQSSPMSSR